MHPNIPFMCVVCTCTRTRAYTHTHAHILTNTIKIIAKLAAKTHQLSDTSSQHKGPNEQIPRGHNCAAQTSYTVTELQHEAYSTN